jgi:creatinine amidohydrolase
MENARGVVPELPEGPDIKWKFNELTPYGATGDPTKATVEKGQKMFEALVSYVVSFIREMDREGWRYGLKKKI